MKTTKFINISYVLYTYISAAIVNLCRLTSGRGSVLNVAFTETKKWICEDLGMIIHHNLFITLLLLM